MAAIRSMLKRVAKLEQARKAPHSPIEVAYGSMDAFAAEIQVGIDAGTYDRIDVPVVIACLRRWHDEEIWGVSGVWKYVSRETRYA